MFKTNEPMRWDIFSTIPKHNVHKKNCENMDVFTK